jgi:hypothetical protein
MATRGYFTVITKSHLAFARVLMSKLRQLDPGADFMVFLADNIDGRFEPAQEAFDVIQPEQYMTPLELRTLTFQYNAFELCCACKAFAHRHIDQQCDVDSWMYFDSDIRVTLSPEPLFHELPSSSVVLSPHTLTPIKAHLAWPAETNILRCGVYNSGWLLMRRSAHATEFIQWFISRLTSLCFDGHRDTFVDQLWLNLAPVHLKGIGITQNAGVNIGYWNLHERHLSFSSQRDLLCNGAAAYFVHFSGWEIERPRQVSKHADYFKENPPPCWEELGELYRAELLEANYENIRCYPYSFARFSNGDLIQPEMRRYYHVMTEKGRFQDVSPFDNADWFKEQLKKPRLRGMRRSIPRPVRQWMKRQVARIFPSRV